MRTSIGVFLFLILFLPVSALSYTHSTSLIQWHEYSDGAFAIAKKENKPVFMLITAIWCHWCNVYEEKSLADKDMAGYINKNFIPIFVDYDKRKDISKQYPATGLPVTVILSPKGERLATVAGYIPKERLLQNLKTTVWSFKSGDMQPQAVTEKETEKRSTGEATRFSIRELKKIISGFKEIVLSNYDPQYGGFGKSQKIPYADVLEVLLYLYEDEKDKKWLDIVANSLDHMAGLKQKGGDKKPDSAFLLGLYKNREGKDWVDRVVELQKMYKISGIYDKIDGGFFRYATERDWSRPHFEKLLSDNADFIRLYLNAYRITKNDKYKMVAEGSLNYVLKTLYNEKENRFYNSQRSDIVYYYLSEKDRKAVGSPDVDRTAFAISQSKMIITLLHAAGLSAFTSPPLVKGGEERLLVKGDERGLSDGRYKEIALLSLQFIQKNILTEKGVLSYYDPSKKEKGLTGQLEENLWAILAFKEAYLYTKDKNYLNTAETLAQFVVINLYDKKQGGFYEFSSKGERPYLLNGLAAYTMLELYKLTNKAEYLKTAKETIGIFPPDKNKPSSPYFVRGAMYLIQE
ncbi:MAG: thioredoxin domain-containing protein [Nitrospinae bacterium]|nr:thioredoxin domain-containing protein [Nitrospinota bacterium]